MYTKDFQNVTVGDNLFVVGKNGIPYITKVEKINDDGGNEIEFICNDFPTTQFKVEHDWSVVDDDNIGYVFCDKEDFVSFIMNRITQLAEVVRKALV